MWQDPVLTLPKHCGLSRGRATESSLVHSPVNNVSHGFIVPAQATVVFWFFSDFLTEKKKKKKKRRIASSVSQVVFEGWNVVCSYLQRTIDLLCCYLSWRLKLRYAHGNPGPRCNDDWLIAEIDPRASSGRPITTRCSVTHHSHLFVIFSIYREDFHGKTFLITCANIRSE